MTALFDARRHEPLTETPWSATRARDAIAAIASEAVSAVDASPPWPKHPLDREADDPAWLWLGLYMGAAGVVWALDELRRAGFVELRRDYAELAAGLHARYLESTDEPRPSLWMGETGLLLTAHRLDGAAGYADAIHALVEANLDGPENELMWGNPGRCSPRGRCTSAPATTAGATSGSAAPTGSGTRGSRTRSWAATSGRRSSTGRCAGSSGRRTGSRATSPCSRTEARGCPRSASAASRSVPRRPSSASPSGRTGSRTGLRSRAASSLSATSGGCARSGATACLGSSPRSPAWLRATPPSATCSLRAAS